MACDDSAGSVFAIDPATGDRTVISGCANAGCSSVVGTGINLVDPDDSVAAGSSLIVADYRAGDGHGTVLSVDPATGNRTTLSGCANDACSSVVGTGRNLVGAASLLRDASSGELFVVDRGSFFSPSPAAVFKIDPANGNRTVLSGCIDAACSSIAGTGPQFSVPSGGAVRADGSLVIADTFLSAVLRVDPVTGNRTIVSGGSPVVGTGPSLGSPLWVEVAGNGVLLVSDPGVGTVFSVDPATGNRTVLSSTSVGTGPGFGAIIGIAELPEPGVGPGLAAAVVLLAWLSARRPVRR